MICIKYNNIYNLKIFNNKNINGMFGIVIFIKYNYYILTSLSFYSVGIKIIVMFTNTVVNWRANYKKMFTAYENKKIKENGENRLVAKIHIF